MRGARSEARSHCFPALRPRPATRKVRCFSIDGRQAKYEAKGSPEAERAALEQAIAASADALAALAAEASGDAADMLEFQLAMLSDEALAAPAFDAIADGEPADAAWRQVLDTEISGYQASR